MVIAMLQKLSLFFLVLTLTITSSLFPGMAYAEEEPDPVYTVTWEFHYKFSGAEANAAAPGNDGFSNDFVETAIYKGEAQVKSIEGVSHVEKLSTIANFTHDTDSTWTRDPEFPCPDGWGASSVWDRHIEISDPDRYRDVSTWPDILRLEFGQTGEGTLVVPFPLRDDPRQWTNTGVDKDTVQLCGGGTNQNETPYSYELIGDWPWREGRIPAGMRENLVSTDGGKTYTLHKTATKVIATGPYITKPFTQEFTIDITITGENKAPEVEAGTPLEGAVGQALQLAGEVTDDGLPQPPGEVTSEWSVETSPQGSSVIFTDDSDPATTATFSAPGDYILKLTASDGEKETSDTVSVTITGFDILTPADGAQINKHMQQVQPGTINFSWTEVADATHYLVSLRDVATGDYKKENANVGLNTSFSESTNGFTFGHEYEFSVTAMTNGSPMEDAVMFKIKVLPEITDPLTQQLHSGQIVWTNTSPDLIPARDTFVQLLQANNWTISYTSAYRTLYYQEHFYLIVDNLKDSHLSPADQALLEQEKAQHGLGTVVALPNQNSPHVQGIAFDANIYDENGNALNGKTWINSQVEDLAVQAGFKKPPHNDKVHFQLK